MGAESCESDRICYQTDPSSLPLAFSLDVSLCAYIQRQSLLLPPGSELKTMPASLALSLLRVILWLCVYIKACLFHLERNVGTFDGKEGSYLWGKSKAQRDRD